jgi:hypothetical protein
LPEGEQNAGNNPDRINRDSRRAERVGPVEPRDEAQRALELAWDLINNTQKFTYGLQYYGPQLGYMVFMISETFDSFISASDPFFYWHLFLNDKPAFKGIDELLLNARDRLRFSFDRYIPEQHVGTMLALKHEFQTSQKLK